MLLILVSSVNKNSPVHRFINALYKASYPYKVYCNRYLVEENAKNTIVLNKDYCLSPRMAKAGIILFGRDFLNANFERDATKRILKDSQLKNEANLIIMPFMHMGDFSSVEIAYRLKMKRKWLLWIHTVDPLPSVEAWGEKPIFRKAVIRSLNSKFKCAELFSANNPSMTNYQVKLMGYKGNSFTHYTISEFIEKEDVYSNSKIQDEINLVYAGSFYGKRNPDLLIKAFEQALISNPQLNIRLLIYGKNNIKLDDYSFSNEVKSRVEIRGFSNNIGKVLSDADVLVDVDANIDGDVFMSGKIVEYLGYYKPLLVLSPKGSPTRELFETNNADQGVFIAGYSLEELANSIKDVACFVKQKKRKLNRESVEHRFKGEVVLQNMVKELKNIV